MMCGMTKLDGRLPQSGFTLVNCVSKSVTRDNNYLLDFFCSSRSSAYIRILRFVGGGASVGGDDDSSTANSASASRASASSSGVKHNVSMIMFR